MHHVRSFPDFATHYYRADRRPFQSLSDLPDTDAEDVLACLESGSRRRFGPAYMALRRYTEAVAREAYVAVGGQPVRQSPHYFVLGESDWFASLYDEPRTVRIPLAELPPTATSFTWTDSITALGLGRHFDIPQPSERWKQQIYRLDQLAVSTATTKHEDQIPAQNDYQFRLLDHYIEIQLWSDEPIRGWT